MNITEIVQLNTKFHLVTQAQVLAWSRTSQDVEANLSVYSESELKTNLVKELLGFDEQLNKLTKELDGKAAFFKKWLSASEDDLRRYTDYTTWTQLIEYLDNNDTKPEYQTMSIDQMKMLAEKERTSIKSAHSEIEVINSILYALYFWKKEKLSHIEIFGRLELEEYLAKQALQDSNKSIASEKLIRSILRKYQLPEQNITADRKYSCTVVYTVVGKKL
ncbi:MAG TPA: hypothetical protein VFF30_08305 [Nitrososphaerales archaeon]|nr:hypothetical protein [Nitrososphaerales archaeon]